MDLQKMGWRINWISGKLMREARITFLSIARHKITRSTWGWRSFIWPAIVFRKRSSGARYFVRPWIYNWQVVLSKDDHTDISCLTCSPCSVIWPSSMGLRDVSYFLPIELGCPQIVAKEALCGWTMWYKAKWPLPCSLSFGTLAFRALSGQRRCASILRLPWGRDSEDRPYRHGESLIGPQQLEFFQLCHQLWVWWRLGGDPSPDLKTVIVEQPCRGWERPPCTPWNSGSVGENTKNKCGYCFNPLNFEIAGYAVLEDGK